MVNSDDIIIGIDLGTTNSVVAVLEGNEPRVIPNSEGANKTPSVVGFLGENKAIVGEMARRQMATNTNRTIYSVKRLMGRFYSEVMETPESDMFRLTSDNNDLVMVDVDGVGYLPQQIASIILRELKQSAEDFLGSPVKKAIVTVPAYFDDLQRTATLEAGRLAGLEVLRLINEPTAAAMAYGLGRERDEKIAVYDFGGGTFDISVMEIDHNAFEVLGCDGDTRLGGDDIDRLLSEAALQRFEEKHGALPDLDELAMRRLAEAAEKAKCELSASRHSQISLPFFTQRDGQPIHLDVTIRREDLEELIEPLVQRTLNICKRALDDANVRPKDLNKVILVGGSTRIPLVQDMVEDFFGLAPFKGVNPDEVVALGAATQAGVLAGALEEVVLLDVASHSFGVEVKNGRTSVIVEKNSTLPIKAAKTFTTTEDNQTYVRIHVLQGELESANDNRSLGKFTLGGIPEAPAGTPRVRVAFFINADGVLEVSAADLHTGNEQKLTITHSFLSEDERRRRDKGRRKSTRRRQRGRRSRGRIAQLEGVPLTPEKPKPEEESTASRRQSQLPLPPDFDEVTGDSAVRVTRPTERMPAHGFAVRGSVEGLPEDFDTMGNTAIRLSPNLTPVTEFDSPKTATGARRSIARPAGGSVARPSPAGIAASATPAATDAYANASATARRVKTLLTEGRTDAEAVAAYRTALPGMRKRAAENPGDPRATLDLAQALIITQSPEEARASLESLNNSEGATLQAVKQMYDELLRRFPKYVRARLDRAEVLGKLGHVDQAITDLEEVLEHEDEPSETANRLASVYQEKLRSTADPRLQFQLVKLNLKLGRLDDAISTLQSLVEVPEYQTQAMRVLGLCYWQKSDFDKTWSLLRALPLDEGLKDELYRLAGDMEAADLLKQAMQVYQRIQREDPNYRDIASRIRTLKYRVRLQGDGTGSSGPVAKRRFQFNHPRFEIIEEINRGAMGIVYKARDMILDEIVALKVLIGYWMADPEAVERFKKEARAAKRLSHPNIVRIHDMFESEEHKFLSMEFIDGKDLKKALAEVTEFSDEALLYHFLRQILEALHYAHGLGVVHRDIKPANIMVTSRDVVKITDFGIAKILTADDATKTGAMIYGTPLYMSPEQIEDGRIDPRSDLYSLGVTCFELVTGYPPYSSGNIEYHHLHTPTPKLPETVPLAFRGFIERCMNKVPDDRFQNAKDALDFLEAAKSF